MFPVWDSTQPPWKVVLEFLYCTLSIGNHSLLFTFAKHDGYYEEPVKRTYGCLRPCPVWSLLLFLLQSWCGYLSGERVALKYLKAAYFSDPHSVHEDLCFKVTTGCEFALVSAHLHSICIELSVSLLARSCRSVSASAKSDRCHLQIVGWQSVFHRWKWKVWGSWRVSCSCTLLHKKNIEQTRRSGDTLVRRQLMREQNLGFGYSVLRFDDLDDILFGFEFPHHMLHANPAD